MYNNSYIGNMPNYNGYGMYQQPRQEAPKMLYGTIDEAKAYIVSPLETVVFINRDKSELYIKNADNMGRSTMQGYKLSALSEEQPKQEIDFTQFVTKQELADAIKQVKGE